MYNLFPHEISLGHHTFRSLHPLNAIPLYVVQFPITHQNGSYIRSVSLQEGCFLLLELSAVSLATLRLFVCYDKARSEPYGPILTDWIV